MICRKSLRTIQIRHLAKLLLNREDWTIVIEDLCQENQGFRDFFIKVLEKASGEYISYESEMKFRLSEDKDFETKTKHEQSASKDSNLLYTKNFSTLLEALKSIFEATVVESHASQLLTLFDFADIHELKAGLVLNFLTFFITHYLSSVLKHPSIVKVVAAIIAEQASEAEAENFVQAVQWFAGDCSAFDDHFFRLDGFEGSLGRPTSLIAPFNDVDQSRYTENIENQEELPTPISFKHQENKQILDQYVKDCHLIWRSALEGSQQNKNSPPSQPQSPTLSHSKVQNGSVSENTVNFQMLKELDHKSTSLNSTISNYFVGCEILRVEFLKAILEYNLKIRTDKKTKRDLISKGLYQMAAEVTQGLCQELESLENASIGEEMDERRCVLCNGKDKYSLGGRLIHLRKQDWIHYNCALWSEGVTEISFGGLEVYQAVKKARTVVCPECLMIGASISGHPDQNKKYHLHCAVKNRCVFSICQSERKVYNLDAWVKNNLNVLQKHYKHCNPLYFLFCTSLEMITSFKATKRLYIVKRQLKGVMSESIKSDTILDLNNSLKELQLKKKATALTDNRQQLPTISRIGGLIVVSLLDKTAVPDSHKTSQQISKLRQQFMLSLRRDMNSVAEEFSEGKKEIYSLMLHKWLIARQLSKTETTPTNASQIEIELYEMTTDLNKPSGLFTIRKARTSGNLFKQRLEHLYSGEIYDIDFPELDWTTVRPEDHVKVLFHNMGLCYGEMRSYLFNTLKSSMEKLKQSQNNFKNYSDYQQIFYQSGPTQHILLDIEEKYSIYDRLKIIRDVNLELESSRDFQRDTKYVQEKQLLGCRSKLNPKSRSFNKATTFQNTRNDNYRFAEKLILQLANQNGGKSQADQPVATSGQVKRKSNAVQKNTEKSTSILKRGYLTYRTLNTMVAPSKIHKYGKLRSSGLFAGKNFQKDEFVIEYIGEVLREPVADLRERRYKKEGFGDCFMFRINKEFIIDATFIGNQARYLNHSCDVTCVSPAKLRFVHRGDRRLVQDHHLRESIYPGRRRAHL